MIQAIEQPQPTLRDRPNGRLDELRDLLADESRHHHDFTTGADDLFVDSENGAIVVRSQGFKEYTLRPHAMGQISSKMSIPNRYLQRCPTELMAENLNYWLHKAGTQRLMLRCDGNEVRAIFSSKFSPVDHGDLVRWVTEKFGHDIPLRYELNESTLDVQFLTDGRHKVSESDLINYGLSLRNSEIGASVVELRGMIFREVCLNGLIVHGGRQEYRRRHVGSASISGAIREAISNLRKDGEQNLKGFSDTKNVSVPEIHAVMCRVDQRYRLNEEKLEAVYKAFEEEPGESLYHVINSLTRAGNSAQLDVDSRRHLQQVGGRLLDLAKSGERWID